MAQEDTTPSWMTSDVEAPSSNTPAQQILPVPEVVAVPIASVASEVNDEPTEPKWLQTEEDPRVVMDTGKMNTVWADATSDVPASGTAKTTTEEKPYTGKRPTGGAVYCDKCCVSSMIGTVFATVMVLEAIRSYVMYSAWLTDKCYKGALKPKKEKEGPEGEEEKEDGCKKCLRLTFVCFTAFLTVLFYLIAIVAIILQFVLIEFFALLTGGFCAMLACSCEYGQFVWEKVRGVGHRTRAAMERHCRPKKDEEDEEKPDPDKTQNGTPAWAE